MTGQPSSSGLDPTLLAADGLILWRMTQRPQQDLWCLIFESSDGFVVVVDDDPDGEEEPVVVEQFSTIISAMDRAMVWKRHLSRWGWSELDVD